MHGRCTLLQLTLEALPGCMRTPHVLFLVRTGTYQYVPLRTSTYRSLIPVLVCTGMYWYVLVHTSTFSFA
jgi:hypothetical protein